MDALKQAPSPGVRPEADKELLRLEGLSSPAASSSAWPWRAVAGEPLFLLADEPTGNLDSQNGQVVMDLLRELHAGGTTICMVTHDPAHARQATRTLRLFDGRIVEDRPSA